MKIQNEILEYLSSKGYYFWRNNSTGLFDARSGTFRRKGKYQVLGQGDIFVIGIDGRFVSIEVKAENGKISKYQQEFMDNVNVHGGEAFVARNVEDVKHNLFLK